MIWFYCKKSKLIKKMTFISKDLSVNALIAVGLKANILSSATRNVIPNDSSAFTSRAKSPGRFFSLAHHILFFTHPPLFASPCHPFPHSTEQELDPERPCRLSRAFGNWRVSTSAARFLPNCPVLLLFSPSKRRLSLICLVPRCVE